MKICAKFQLVMVACLAAVGLHASPTSDVYISEIMADPSDRLLREEDGRQRLGHGLSWSAESYDDSRWQVGSGPFGIAQPDQATDLAPGYANNPNVAATYLRTRFDVSPGVLAGSEPLAMIGTLADGAVVFLNGVEVGRGAMGSPGAHLYFDQPAHLFITQLQTEFTIPLPAARALLRPSGNVLAVHLAARNVDRDGNRFVPERMRFAMALRSGTDVLVPVGANWRYLTPSYEPSGGLLDPQVAASASGGFADWVELHNRSAQAVDLSGWALTDDRTRPRKWPIPAGTTIPAGGYLVVLADSLSPARGRYLHTNFGFSSGGEFAGLTRLDGSVASAFDFPRQTPFVSYGWSETEAGYRYFNDATPAAPNAASAGVGFAADPQFLLPQGFHDGFPSVGLSAAEGSEIRYTIDGSEPTASSTLYQAPIGLLRSTVIRARAFSPGRLPSRTVTQSYFVNVPSRLRGVPAISLAIDPQSGLFGPHGLSSVQGGSYLANTAMPQAQAWVPTSLASVNNHNQRGRNFERQAQLAYVDPVTGINLSYPAGLRIAGSFQTRSLLRDIDNGQWSYIWTNTPSFNVYARSAYGQRSFDVDFFPGWSNRSFTKLRLNSIKDPFSHDSFKDALVLRMFQDAGAITVRDRFATLWVNGTYRGYYRWMETYTEEFFKGAVDPSAAWDIVDTREIEAGSSAKLDELLNFVKNNDQSIAANFERTGELMDINHFIDYLSINLWVANRDWLTNNWVAARPQRAGAQIRFYSWDAEKSFVPEFLTTDMVQLRIKNPALANNGIVDLARILIEQSADFRQRFADRQAALFGWNGAIGPGRLGSRLQELRSIVEPLSQETYDPPGSAARYGTQFHWRPLPMDELTQFIAYRGTHYFNSLKTHGLANDRRALRADPPAGNYNDWIDLRLLGETSLAPGEEIYYTLDGSDPRAAGGGIRGTRYLGPVTLQQSANVKARTYLDGTWGPLFTASYQLAANGRLIIQQFSYHPKASSAARSSALEFVEIQNIGRSTARLAGVRLAGDISFTAPDVPLASGARIIVAANPAVFRQAYAGADPLGPWTGELGNDGGTLRLVGTDGNPIAEVRYDDDNGWPVAADGGGAALQRTSVDDLNSPQAWMPTAFGGSFANLSFSAATPIASSAVQMAMGSADSTLTHDGNRSTQITLLRSGDYVQYNLPQEVLLTDLELAIFRPFCFSGSCIPRWHIDVSRDGQTWTRIVDRRSGGSTSSPPLFEVIDVPDSPAKHIRVIFEGGGFNPLRLAEVVPWSN